VQGLYRLFENYIFIFYALMTLSYLIEQIQQHQLKKERTKFSPGDTVRVAFLVTDENKQRIQIYQGTLIAQHRSGVGTTITIRRISQGFGMECVFLLHSPLIKTIEVIRRSKVRRARLYYLRNLKGKAARLREKFYP
jgi:large subunit ribosomal protein L19